MVGKLIKSQWPTALLAIILAKIIWLYITGDIAYYIHPRYFDFAFTMSVFGLVAVAASTTYSIYSRQFTPMRFGLLDGYVLAIAISLLLVAPVPLSVENTERRNIVTQAVGPDADKQDQVNQNFECPNTDLYTSMEQWITAINVYPDRCFDGEPFSARANFFDDNTQSLPPGLQYFGRMYISCCIVDAQPYALPVEVGDRTFQKKQLYALEGRFELRTVNRNTIFVIVPTAITTADDPSGPYEYRGVSSSDRT